MGCFYSKERDSEFCESLTKIRCGLRFTQGQFASLLRMPLKTYNAFETGQREPNVGFMEKIRVCGILTEAYKDYLFYQAGYCPPTLSEMSISGHKDLARKMLLVKEAVAGQV